MINGPQLKVLSAEEVGTIYEKCMIVLSKKGVHVNHSDVLKILDRQGAEVDFDGMQVRFPKDIIEAALKKVPHTFRLAGREEKHDIVIPDSDATLHARNGSGAFRYYDPEFNTYKDVALEYVREVAQFVERLEGISFCAFPSPLDAPKETADIHALKILLGSTSKHINIQPYSADSVSYILELAQVATEGIALKEKPIVSLSPNAFTPLGLKSYDVEVIIQSTRMGVPIHCWSLPSTGGTSPVTIAGTVLIIGIEILSMIVLSQLISPGSPVIAGPFPFTTDMATGNSLNSSVEVVLATAAAVQFLKEAFHVPTNTYGFGTDSPVTDEQAMIEVTLKGLTASLAGSDLISGAGMINSINGFSLLQLVIDDTLAGILKRMRKGVEVNEDTLALNEILDTNAGEHFLERAHTLTHCREALPVSLFISQSWEDWVSEGEKDLYERALEKYSEIKKNLSTEPLSDDIQKELNRIVRKADKYLVQ